MKPVFQPKIIKCERDREPALAEVLRLAARDPPRDTPDSERLELLVKLIEDYEAQHAKAKPEDPVDAIQTRMREDGLQQKDLAPILGGKNRASEILARKRPLTLPMIRALNAELGIPASILIREYRHAGPSTRQGTTPKRGERRRG
jgi:HTH-type transcriptional regulator/antitoxin HigA